MRIRAVVLSSLIGAVVLSVCFERPQTPSIALANPADSRDESKADEHPLKIGVVSIKKIFKDCKKSIRYRDEAVGEQNRVTAELRRLFEELEAEKAGLKEGDILLEFNNEKITSENSLAKIIQKYLPGDKVVLEILRDGEKEIVSATLGERSE